jgi:hypothetical protein
MTSINQTCHSRYIFILKKRKGKIKLVPNKEEKTDKQGLYQGLRTSNHSHCWALATKQFIPKIQAQHTNE